MKRSYLKTAAFLFSILFLFSQFAVSGCDLSEGAGDTETDIGTTVGESGQFSGLGQSDVDFYLSTGDLQCLTSGGSSKLLPGGIIKVQAKVHKSTSTAASGFVVFSIGGIQLDKVPFFMDASDNYITVKANCNMPFEAYETVEKGNTVSDEFKAEVIAGEISNEINESDNTAVKSVTITGADITANEYPGQAVILSVYADSDLEGRALVPGETITLHASVSGQAGSYLRAYFYAGGIKIGDKQCYLTKPNGTAILNFQYCVPQSATDEIDFHVSLETGGSGSLTLAVTPCDYFVKTQGISWEYRSNAVYLTCDVFKNSPVSFGDTSDELRYVFVINGVAYEPIKAGSVSAPYMAEVNCLYRLPNDVTWPLEVHVVADAGGLFSEYQEDNNIATVLIPESSGGTEITDLSVESVWSLPSVLVPGETIQLFAAVKNNSAQAASGFSEDFSVNGTALDPNNALYSGSIDGGQYKIFQDTWTVPDDFSGDLEFLFSITPGSSQSDDDLSDNTAGQTLTLAEADLTVGAISISNEGETLYAGSAIELSAIIVNSGALPVSNAEIRFLIDDVIYATRTVDIPSYGSVSLNVPYVIPVVEDETVTEAAMTGITGEGIPSGMGGLDYSVTVDASNLIAESDETNNTAGPKRLNVVAGTNRGVVVVRVRNLGYDPISNAEVTLAAGEQTTNAITDAYGYCTFVDVPFGSYTASAGRTGYNVQTYEDELYEGNGSDLASIYLDNFSYISGTVTSASGSALSGVKVTVKDTNYKAYTDENGVYTFKISAGNHEIEYRFAGYAPVYKKIDLSLAENKTVNIAMNTTDLTYLSGYVFGDGYAAISLMKIEAFTTDGQVLATAYSDAEGFFATYFPISAQHVENIRVRVSGQGLYKEQGLDFYRGLETEWNFSFMTESAETGMGDVLSSADIKVVAWAECASVPSTMFTQGYEVRSIYGPFGFKTFVTATDSCINHLSVETTPDYWNYNSVSGTWSPTDLISTNNELLDLGINVVSMIFPTDVPISMGFHSSNKTMVYIKKIVILSDGIEVCDPVYPNLPGSYAFAPDVQVNWDNCLIKYYLRVVPDDGVSNPASGYHYDCVLILFNPKTKELTIRNYIVVGKDPNTNDELYMDE
ncbi:MAG TPA: carboxypeptidase regulatory-like domain-containing protein [Oscillospiraceae bacterium]|nr:carboxypeptidase regulatory-like domain-containing protein [Oscillospiraceae bacterium]HPF56000.1 carboxypeptidase regulatory-like domain-containing protein [Clostridiales bacterium]HPK36338.1 carboxypeptidase regulatory-like domain-containing protein [Oscillospiraceae bacterium]HPR76111.1 carboxypeptidase regulatory-like domain-containing protein [Oscillospiraceae bacterium]